MTLCLLKERNWLPLIERMWKSQWLVWFYRCARGRPPGECPQLLSELPWGFRWTERSKIPRWGGWSLSSHFPFTRREMTSKGLWFSQKICTLLLLLSAFKMHLSSWVLFFSVGNRGNYYFTVSPAENESSESVYFLYSAMFRKLPLRSAFCFPTAFV